MILYFSGTGNSQAIALSLAKLTGDETHYCQANASPIDINHSSSLGFVFPVHAWGLPQFYEEYIKCILTQYFQSNNSSIQYVYMVCTCGDDIGKTDVLLEKLLRKYKLPLDSRFSVIMPNTYIGLPGFNTDNLDLVEQKLKNATTKVSQIATIINQRIRGYQEINPGKFPWLKSYILRPLFHLRFTTTNRFHVDIEKCIGCGICSKVCPTQNIMVSLNGPRIPHWNKYCTDCLACYHHCPHQCIEYGKFSKNKGQYVYKTSSIGTSQVDTGKESTI
ncbi:MAG: EFR1 family ferrodoxin [Bacteroidaceae bacterium]|nr:EFR1 family ferrodoxin [Bacteroidaceae bacterium]